MKCPVCQAKLLPVAGEMFCLQCGESVHAPQTVVSDSLELEDTTDPLLRRAIRDSGDLATVFTQSVQIQNSPMAVTAKRSFASLGNLLTPQIPVVAAMTMAGVLPPQAYVATPPTPVVSPVAPPVVAPVTTIPVAPRPSQHVAQAVYPAAGYFGAIAKAWVIGFAGLAIFIGMNYGVGRYYQDRVYPGVHVGNIALGGVAFSELPARLGSSLPVPKLNAQIDGQDYPLDLNAAGTLNTSLLERDVRQAGRAEALPLLAVVNSYFSHSVAPSYAMNDAAVAKAVDHLTSLVERKPSNAVNIINGSNVFVLGEKSGVTLDAGAAAAIRSAYGHSQTAILKTTRVNPAVTANDISGDTAQAQAIIASVVAIITPKRSDSPRPEQIASWLIFNGPGKGVSVDPAGVANYVAAIPGSFDRAAATTALAAALTAHQSTTISPSLKHVTPSPKPASLIASTPVITYTYCAVENTTIGSDLPGVIAAAIAANPGWTLGRKVAFAPTATGCNLAFQVADTGTLKSLAPACETQTSCRIHNDLAISTNAWSHVPTTWVGSQDSYHRELVNHVLGQWLGFDHPSCSVGAAAANVIATPYISITGCSAKWYQVPLETQDTKVLAGF